MEMKFYFALVGAVLLGVLTGTLSDGLREFGFPFDYRSLLTKVISEGGGQSNPMSQPFSGHLQLFTGEDVASQKRFSSHHVLPSVLFIHL
jgi:hypothetical protein